MKGISTQLSGDELVFSHSKQLVEEYHMKAKQGFAWATITISHDGSFSAQSDFGNFSYAWPRHGRDSFKHFLIEIIRGCEEYPQGYFYDKIKSSDRENRVDMPTTLKNIKKLIIQARRDAGVSPFTSGNMRECTAAEARDLWSELDELERRMDSIISQDLFYSTMSHMPELKNHIIHWEAFVENYDDMIEYTYDTRALAFCKYILPAFRDILKKELEESNAKEQEESGSPEPSGISTAEAKGT